MRLVSLALVVALALLVGCASFPQYKNSQLSLNELKVEKIDTAFYSVKVIGIDGNEAPAFNGVMQKEIKDVFRDSGAFGHYYLSDQNSDLFFEMTFANSGSFSKSVLLGALSGATYFLLPVYVTDNWTLEVKVFKDGKLQKQFKYQDELRTWLHLTMLFIAPFKPTLPETKHLLNNMVAHFLADYAKEVRA